MSERGALQSRITRRPGAELLVGAMDSHVHACPHINSRSLDVFEAVQDAASVGMVALGLMDNFSSSSGYAALARRHLGHLGVDVFGGLIMEPPAGGVSAEAVRASISYGYSAPGDGARFVSLPTHHTRHIATQEGRSPTYVDGCLGIPANRPIPDPLPEILDLVAAADIVLNTGHVSGPEAVRVVEQARERGVTRILVPASHYDVETIAELVRLGARAEFSFFFVSHATGVGLTHVDAAANTVAPVALADMVDRIRVAGPDSAVLSSDCGVGVLPPPVEGLREFIVLAGLAGIDQEALRRMTSDTPRRLFRVTPPVDD